MNDWYKEEEGEAEEPTKAKKEEGTPSRGAWIIAGSILLGGLIISASILSSSGKLQKLADSGSAAVAQQPSGNPTPAAQQPAGQPSGPVRVSVDNDPVLGNKNAPVTLIEFSDYECPFCKKSFTDLLPELKKNYIDTGKVKLVYRDFPLSFHANAQKEAEAAECARSQSNDATYFKFHDQIFTQTTAGGTGLALTQLPVIAKNLGLNVNQFQQCLDSGKFKDEVAKDMADGSAVGVSGTPSWVVGTSSKDGKIEGQLIVGAQPFSSFKGAIDVLLK
ncbi:DsbA family protein [Candidatus Dojkabacteria bacterium]|uniref:DsbA family protein n=1 Tax=Candidatus Dojkabacteria bacterium TaxID=2099670 RepID=A0A5C7J752_9BACT|nr:MAG: DsbA family protein [Candidatus Dojkabacteria bacterium]